MKVVITGGTGFIGRMLARRIVELGRLAGPSGRPEEVDEILLFDTSQPSEPLSGLDDRVKVVTGDVTDRDQLGRLIDRDDVSVFHLASVVSAGAELAFDLAISVNLMGGSTCSKPAAPVPDGRGWFSPARSRSSAGPQCPSR